MPDCLPRYATPRTHDDTYGPAAARVAELCGTPLMPWQRQVLDVALEAKPNGLLAHRLLVLTVPRQQGKSVLIRTLALWTALRAPGRRVILSTAQTRWDARERFEEGTSSLAASPLGDGLKRVYQGAGTERAVFANGSMWRIFSPTDDAAHGSSVDLAIVDEAFAVREAVVQGLAPAMIARPDPLLVIVSTAGTDASVMLRRFVELGRSGEAPMVYFEWSAPDDADPADESVWQSCMPALGHTVSLDVIRHFAATLDPSDFSRAFLNRWTRTVSEAIPAALWARARDPKAKPGAGLVFGVDLAVDRSAASVVAAGVWKGDVIAVELVEMRDGVDWLAGRLRALVGKWHAPIVVDGYGPAGTLADQLARAGVTTVRLSTSDLSTACGAFLDGLRAGKVAHRGDSRLDGAVGAATRRPLGDRWIWDRRRAPADISPLVAATIAWARAASPPAAPKLVAL